MDLAEMEMKKTEDQISYSDRKEEILKEAHELAVHCDAEVSIIMCSNTNEFHGYTSPNSSIKKIIDQYQSTLGIDLWSTHYEKMQEELRRLKDINNALRRDIKHRFGEELDELNMEQLCSLENNMLQSLQYIRYRKFQVLRIQTDICMKKIRNAQLMQESLRGELVKKQEYPYGVVENEGDDDSAEAFADQISNLTTMQQRLSLRDLRVQGSFERDDSCSGSTVTMDVENSP